MTPDEVKAIIERAKANSEDPGEIEEMYQRVLDSVSGDEQKLAKAWALHEAMQELQELVAEGRRAITGHG